MTPAWRHVVWKMFCGDIPTGPEVTGVHTLNFKPNFKFSRLEFFGKTPVPLRVCAIKAWSISSACKNLWAYVELEFIGDRSSILVTIITSTPCEKLRPKHDKNAPKY